MLLLLAEVETQTIIKSVRKISHLSLALLCFPFSVP